MKKYSGILKISAIFAGAVLGAGFAGGREIVTFFVSYGKPGIFGALAAGILFALFGSAILYTSKKYGCDSFESYLDILFKKRTSFLFGAVVKTFLIVCFFIMLSGGGALFKQIFNLPELFGSFLTAVVVFFVLSSGVDGMGKVCSVMSPVMLLGILFTNVFSLLTNTVMTYSSGEVLKNNAAFSSILYVSYNMLSCAPVLATSAHLADTKKSAALGGIFGGAGLMVVSFMTSLCLYLAGSDAVFSELPMLLVSSQISTLFFYIYALILYMAILTTAFSCGMPLVKKISSLGVSDRLASGALCLVALPLSLIKFSVLVEYCYTFFGYLGLVLLYKIFTRSKKYKQEIF